jgi:hypothetical protein
VSYRGLAGLGLLRSRGSAGLLFLGGLTSPCIAVRVGTIYDQVSNDPTDVWFSHTFGEVVRVLLEASSISNGLDPETPRTGAKCNPVKD